MLTFGNGIIGMQVFSDFDFVDWVDWAKYFLALAQLASDSFIALKYCDYALRLSPLIKGEPRFTQHPVSYYDPLLDTLKIISLSLNAFDAMISFLGGYYFLTTFNATSLIVGSAFLALKFLSNV